MGQKIRFNCWTTKIYFRGQKCNRFKHVEQFLQSILHFTLELDHFLNRRESVKLNTLYGTLNAKKWETGFCNKILAHQLLFTVDITFYSGTWLLQNPKVSVEQNRFLSLGSSGFDISKFQSGEQRKVYCGISLRRCMLHKSCKHWGKRLSFLPVCAGDFWRMKKIEWLIWGEYCRYSWCFFTARTGSRPIHASSELWNIHF